MGLRYGLLYYVVGHPCHVLINGYSYLAVIQRDLGDSNEVKTRLGVSIVPKSNTFASSYYWLEVK